MMEAGPSKQPQKNGTLVWVTNLANPQKPAVQGHMQRQTSNLQTGRLQSFQSKDRSMISGGSSSGSGVSVALGQATVGLTHCKGHVNCSQYYGLVGPHLGWTWDSVQEFHHGPCYGTLISSMCFGGGLTRDVDRSSFEPRPSLSWKSRQKLRRRGFLSRCEASSKAHAGRGINSRVRRLKEELIF